MSEYWHRLCIKHFNSYYMNTRKLYVQFESANLTIFFLSHCHWYTCEALVTLLIDPCNIIGIRKVISECVQCTFVELTRVLWKEAIMNLFLYLFFVYSYSQEHIEYMGRRRWLAIICKKKLKSKLSLIEWSNK